MGLQGSAETHPVWELFVAGCPTEHVTTHQGMRKSLGVLFFDTVPI